MKKINFEIDEGDLDIFIDQIEAKMEYCEPDPNGPDYHCIFCQRTPKPPTWTILHKNDCPGVALLKIFRKMKEEINS